jgi:integrase
MTSSDSNPKSKPSKARATTARTTAKKTAKKPYKDFPLTLHRSGQWCKKVRGKIVYFGRDPLQARDRWLREKDDRLAGRTPQREDSDCLTIERLVNLFMESREGKVQTGEITERSYRDYHETVRHLVEGLGRTADVLQLVPSDFRRLRAKLAKGVGLKTLDGRIRRTRAVFNHASKNGWIEKNLNTLWGTEFNPPSKTAIRKASSQVEKLFTADEVRRLVELASPQLRAMILLAIQGGYGNLDLAMIERQDIQDGWLTRRRNKTGTKRRTPLWTETLQAIDEALKVRPEAKSAEHSELLFLTRCGVPWVRPGSVSALAHEFRKLAKQAKITVAGKSFYSLRHTFQTVGDETKDFVAVSALMGHVDGSISGHYRERIDDNRLRAVVDHVRKWLFG